MQITAMILERSDGHFEPSFSMEDTALGKLVLGEMLIENWTPLLIDDMRKREVLLQLRNHR